MEESGRSQNFHRQKSGDDGDAKKPDKYSMRKMRKIVGRNVRGKARSFLDVVWDIQNSTLWSIAILALSVITISYRPVGFWALFGPGNRNHSADAGRT